MAAEDAQNRYILEVLQQKLARYNHSLSQSELAYWQHKFQRTNLGAKREDLFIVVIVTVIYSIIFVTGIIGNVCTCLVIARNKYMRTVTNYYLFNLSVSDLLLLLVGLPHETYTTWSVYPFPFGVTTCRMIQMTVEASAYNSILTITAFTLERYFAICHPISFPVRTGMSRSKKVIPLIWMISILCSVPVGLQFGIVYQDLWGVPILESAQCNILNQDVARIVYQVSTIVFFAFPMSVISLLYVLIGLAIRNSSLKRTASGSSCGSSPNTLREGDFKLGSSNNNQDRIRRSVLKMLVAVVVAFFLCWAPFHTQRLLAVHGDNSSHVYLTVHYILFYVSGVTYYLSATINPVLYSIISIKFREAFQSTLLCRSCWKRHRRRRGADTSTYTCRYMSRSHIKTHSSMADISSFNDNKISNQGNDEPETFCCTTGNDAMCKLGHHFAKAFK